jgi:hypothetical protein
MAFHNNSKETMSYASTKQYTLGEDGKKTYEADDVDRQ